MTEKTHSFKRLQTKINLLPNIEWQALSKSLIREENTLNNALVRDHHLEPKCGSKLVWLCG